MCDKKKKSMQFSIYHSWCVMLGSCDTFLWLLPQCYLLAKRPQCKETRNSILPSLSVIYFVLTQCRKYDYRQPDQQLHIKHTHAYFYMLNYEQLGLHSVVEAGVCVTIVSCGSLQLGTPDWTSIIKHELYMPYYQHEWEGDTVKMHYYSKIILGRN